MKAKVARDLAKSAVGFEIKKINAQIESEALKGKTRIVVSDVSQGAIAFFTDEGYDISTITYNESYAQVIINW